MNKTVPSIGPTGLSDPYIYGKPSGGDVMPAEDIQEEPGEGDHSEDENTHSFSYQNREVGRRSINNNTAIAALIAKGMNHAQALKEARKTQDVPRDYDYPDAGKHPGPNKLREIQG